MIYEIRSEVKNGIVTRNRNLLTDAIQSFEGKQITIRIERTKKKRSNPQNSYYWGCCLPLIQLGFKEVTGEFRTAENLHYNILLPLFAPIKEIPNKLTGEIVKEKVRSSEMNTTQFSEYILEIQKWSAEFLGIYLPEPNENIKLELD